MVFQNMSCDRMSHDHLQCDRRTMRHRDTNRIDAMNLDVNHRMMVCPMMIDQMKILVMKSANYYHHDLMDVSLNY
jgi:hypothetical protein